MHVHLRFSLRGGLEVVVPPGFDRCEIPGLLREKTRWIERDRRELDAQRLLLDPWPHDRIPERIELRRSARPGLSSAFQQKRVASPSASSRPASPPLRAGRRCRAVARGAQALAGTEGADRHLADWVDGSRRLTACGTVGLDSLAEEPLGQLLAPWRPSSRAALLGDRPSRSTPHSSSCRRTSSATSSSTSSATPSGWITRPRSGARLENGSSPQARALREELRSAWRYVPCMGRSDVARRS